MHAAALKALRNCAVQNNFNLFNPDFSDSLTRIPTLFRSLIVINPHVFEVKWTIMI